MKNKLNLDTFYAKKIGMTTHYDNSGLCVPVTIIEIIPNYIIQVKSTKRDGYNAYKLGYGKKALKNVRKPILGALKIVGESMHLCSMKMNEVRVKDSVDVSVVGSGVSIDEFKVGIKIDITSFSKGKGFQGVIKKYNFSGGPASHGSHFHRKPGAIGNRATPARVFKERKMPGRMGFKKVTIRNQEIVKIDSMSRFILVRGNIPGSNSSFVKVKKSEI